MSDIIFLTTSMQTKWINYSKKQVKKFFPESEHIIVDGKKGWPHVWFNWINLVPNTAKWFIHIDEDCFLLNSDPIYKIIDKMEKEDYSLAGVPDSGFRIRGFNPVALNPFFMIGNVEHLLNIRKDKFLKSRKWKSDYIKTPDYRFDFQKRMHNPNYEMYYTLFWTYLEYRKKFLYLYPEDLYEFADKEKKIPPTGVKNLPNEDLICIHMWFLRQWNKPPHDYRYKKIEEYLNCQI